MCTTWFTSRLTYDSVWKRAQRTPLLLLFCDKADARVQTTVKHMVPVGYEVHVLYDHEADQSLLTKFHVTTLPQVVLMHCKWVYILPVITEDTLRAAVRALPTS